NWEGRVRPFGRAIESSAGTDHRMLSLLADTMGHRLGTETIESVRKDIDQLGQWTGTRVSVPTAQAQVQVDAAPGTARLATWHQLIDNGALQIAERFLAGTAKAPVARISATTAQSLGLAEGDLLEVSTEHGAIDLPVAITKIADNVVWLPMKSVGSHVHRDLNALPGDIVTLGAPRVAVPTSAQPAGAGLGAVEGNDA
ncbi:molybdopterin dinucleotide binding domain-containing protein, partial [Timonella senegalensis]|uniref:molybdopterin dinucleotide binding domain-containing protein n=1 Tax=Timonella senegalensis TaxID=1465825 RepID=UPI0028A670CD